MPPDSSRPVVLTALLVQRRLQRRVQEEQGGAGGAGAGGGGVAVAPPLRYGDDSLTHEIWVLWVVPQLPRFAVKSDSRLVCPGQTPLGVLWVLTLGW